jgi:hypothetical protein
MEICKTDIGKIIRLLRAASVLIDSKCDKPCQQDKARQMRLMIKKLMKLYN